MPANRQYAAPDSWEQHRNEIERLYVHENRTLKAVMEIMAREHGHCATKKMYKTRLAKWKLDCKYNKKRYMKVISQKWRERAALGKGSVFTVRGKVVPGAEINRYLKRRSRYAGGQASDMKSTPTTNTPSTPSSIGEWTPSPSPGAQSATTTPTVSVEGLLSHADSMNLVATLDSDSFEIPRTIHLIQIPELLFRQIHRYINSCFDSGVWLPIGPEIIASTRLTATLPNIGDTQCNPSTFFECCVSASRLLMQHKYDAAGRQLSTACAMVKPILLADDPRALQVFLNVLLLFKQQGFKEVADQLRRYIGAIAQYSTTEGPRSTTSTPLKQICGSLAETVADIQMSPTRRNSTHIRTQDDSDTDVLVAAWRCIVDSYQQQLGQVHGAVISCEMELLGRQTEARSADLQGAETNLRKMLHSCENLTGLDSAATYRLLLAWGFNLFAQARHEEAATLAVRLISRSSRCPEPGAYLSMAFGHELLALCYDAQFRWHEAVSTFMCSAQQMAVHHGWSDPWVVRAMSLVSSWQLKTGGRLAQPEARANGLSCKACDWNR